MYRCPSYSNNAVLGEYRETAEALFPPGGLVPGQGLDLKAVENFSVALGVGAEYQRLLLLDKNDAQMGEFLFHFQNNLDLLIQKTWVEKADEERRDKLQDEIPGFMDVLGRGDYQLAFEQFGAILEELAYLLFGPQSAKEDFTEYTFRFDTQMGLFWWYGGQIAGLKEAGGGVFDSQTLWALLLVGICYLTNF